MAVANIDGQAKVDRRVMALYLRNKRPLNFLFALLLLTLLQRHDDDVAGAAFVAALERAGGDVCRCDSVPASADVALRPVVDSSGHDLCVKLTAEILDAILAVAATDRSGSACRLLLLRALVPAEAAPDSMDAAAPPVLKHLVVAGHTPVDYLAALTLTPLQVYADWLVRWNNLRLRSRICGVISTDR